MGSLLVERMDDEGVIDRVFLQQSMRKHLSDREHAVLALRNSGYTRSSIVQILDIGKTTVYTCERTAIAKLKAAYLSEMDEEEI